MEKKSIDTYFQLSTGTIVVIKILESNQNTTVLPKEIHTWPVSCSWKVLNDMKLIKNHSEPSQHRGYFSFEILSMISNSFHPLPLASVNKAKKKIVSGTIPILRQHIFGLFLTHPPTHPLEVINQHKYSTERQQNWQFTRPTHPVLW